MELFVNDTVDKGFAEIYCIVIVGSSPRLRFASRLLDSMALHSSGTGKNKRLDVAAATAICGVTVINYVGCTEVEVWSAQGKI